MLDSASIPSASAIAGAILSAPGWCRVGITQRDPDMRERAAETLALSIVETLAHDEPRHDPDQLALPLA